MTRSFAAALVATAALAFPAHHASAQGIKQDVKTAATAGEGKKVGSYVKHRFTKRHRRPAAKHRTAKPDSVAH